MEKFSDDKISIIFPAYNEEENIEKCITTAYDILKEIVSDFEIIIINDGSQDNTGEICLDLAKRLPKIRIISKEKNEGYGQALKDGFRNANFNLIFFSDSDNQFDISDLKGFFKYIDTYDIVIGYRKTRTDPFIRRFFSRSYNLLVKLVLNIDITDTNCAFKLFKKHIFDKITIESKSYCVNAEILAKAKMFNFSIKELAVSYFPRYKGKSKIRLLDIPITLKEITRIVKTRMKR